MTSREIVESYMPMAKYIAKVFGPRCEVILHCLDDMEHSIIAVENGHVTGRTVGGCITDFALKILSNKIEGNNDRSFVTNYYGKTEDGKVLRSSTYFIRNPEGAIVGLLCINVDITEMYLLKELAEWELTMDEDVQSNFSDPKDTEKHVESFSLSVEGIVETLFQSALSEMGENLDPTKLTKKEKECLIAKLYDQNLFAFKNAISFMSEKLRLSVPSVYRYLQEIRSDRIARKGTIAKEYSYELS